jgi:hypothetical protein
VTTPLALSAAVAAAATALLAGCSGSSPSASGPPASSPPTSPSAAAEDCPDVTGADGYAAAIDYVDFVQAFGRQYVVSTNSTNTSGRFEPELTRKDLGRVVLRSKCSFSALNDRTQKSPGEPHDGDTGFLPPGTAIYAVHGWSKHCQLAAEHDGRMHVYLAYRNDTKVATPRNCALGHLM